MNAILPCYDVLREAKAGRRFQDYHRCRMKRSRSSLRSGVHIVLGLVLIVAGAFLGLVPVVPGFLLGVPGIALIGGEFQVTARLLDRWEPAVRRFVQKVRGRK